MRAFSAVLTALILVPAFALAQTGNLELETKIRADLLKDPRTASLSQAEFDALVRALSQNAMENGTADTYLADNGTFGSGSTAPSSESIATPMLYALGLLLAALLMVGLYFLRMRRSVLPSDPAIG